MRTKFCTTAVAGAELAGGGTTVLLYVLAAGQSVTGIPFLHLSISQGVCTNSKDFLRQSFFLHFQQSCQGDRNVQTYERISHAYSKSARLISSPAYSKVPQEIFHLPKNESRILMFSLHARLEANTKALILFAPTREYSTLLCMY